MDSGDLLCVAGVFVVEARHPFHRFRRYDLSEDSHAFKDFVVERLIAALVNLELLAWPPFAILQPLVKFLDGGDKLSMLAL